ncbi:DUF6503 family protein [Flavobacteriaceae bacterium 14752]|uniref:DUF6503 family protein n=1 Tax=Mesohalobacter salilacus TaxID=2491711 RepID=UPI000F639056|nr:hypothetical protein EIG84_04230 [Flavobacteriaceae bacterium 14752]
MNKFLILVFLVVCFESISQNLTAEQVLDKSIAYHDPQNRWESFNDSLLIHLKMPNGSQRMSKVKIDILNEYFSLLVNKDNDTILYELHKNKCKLSINNNENLSDSLKQKYNLNCKRAKMYKNYYTYLYGLPMKLKDEGTIISPKIETKTLNSKSYLTLKVNYKENVGSDVWYFYFNPKTYALEAYQFFKDESKNDGEYILLSDIETISGIKMPKYRKWITNKEDKYLGTDVLLDYKR